MLSYLFIKMCSQTLWQKCSVLPHLIGNPLWFLIFHRKYFLKYDFCLKYPPIFSSYELQSFLALGTQNWPLSFRCGNGHWFCGPMPHVSCASTAACSIRNHVGRCTRPGTRHRKEVPDEVKKGMSNYGGGKGRLEIQRIKKSFVCHLSSTCGWKYLVENEILLYGLKKELFLTQRFHYSLLKKKTWLFVSTESNRYAFYWLDRRLSTF